MKKFYITTSIAYTNAPPHIGFALELIQADAFARHRRLLGDNLWFLTGTDEHGLKIAQKAKEAGMEPPDFCDDMASKFKSLTKKLNISNDDFIRTTDQQRHWPGVYKLWNKMKASGDIYEKEYEGLYCIGCEAFIKEQELVKGDCLYHKKKPEKVKEKNYFFRLSKYSDQIINNLNNKVIEIIPANRKNEMISFIKQGLADISFSRPKESVAWGIPVPGDDSQSIYVWGDALTNYISAVGYGREEENFYDYWPADIHFIGKDIAKFHIIIWPGMLISAGLPLPQKIFIHGFLTVDGQKMSKSIGNVVDPFNLISAYGADAVRYFLLREISPFEDGDFSQEKFKERYNADLAGGLGNLTARIITLAATNSVKDYDQANITIINQVEKTKKNRNALMEEFKFNIALEEIWGLIAFADSYVEKNRPWEANRENRKEVIGDLLFLLDHIADLVEAFMPETAINIKKQIKEGKSSPLFKRVF